MPYFISDSFVSSALPNFERIHQWHADVSEVADIAGVDRQLMLQGSRSNEAVFERTISWLQYRRRLLVRHEFHAYRFESFVPTV